MISATRSAGEGRFDDDEAVRSENVRTEDESPFIYIHIYRPDWTRLSVLIFVSVEIPDCLQRDEEAFASNHPRCDTLVVVEITI